MTSYLTTLSNIPFQRARFAFQTVQLNYFHLDLCNKAGADDDEEIDDKDEKGGSDELLRDFQYALKCQFMERARNLRATCLTKRCLFLFFSFPDTLTAVSPCHQKGSQRDDHLLA